MTEKPIYPEELIRFDEDEDTAVELATRIAQKIILIRDAGLNVDIPNSAIKYVEEIFEDWFSDVSSIAKYHGDPLFLVERKDREISLHGTDLDWAQGIGVKELRKKYDEIFNEEGEQFTFNFPILSAKGPFAHLSTRQLTSSPLSGHYNRFWPMKLSLRVLLNMVLTAETYGDQDGWGAKRESIHIEDFRERALETAIYAKKYFQQIDVRNQFTVGEEITVGLPHSSKDTANYKKSEERFVSQFVGSIRNKGKGSLCELGFIIVDEGNGEIEMTREGLWYALTPNSIIDRTSEGLKGVGMSLEEKYYMATHIKKYLAEEWKIMKQIALEIHEMRTNPQQLDDFIQKEYDWSTSKSNQVRNGCISRMVEMGFVKRKKEGREVSYQITQLAEKLLLEIK